ncbi:MAG: twin-arginine translocase TatA/TatE family subunit [Deltaproteobacteria bacterium]|nr:twin-arginine translocase TatA/TatE family subunit [Deltaproteobacteria bacterium]
MPGMGELVIILLIVLVVFGANKLPAIGDALGRSIKNFKRSSKVDDDDKKDDDADSKDKGDAKLLSAKPQNALDKATASKDKTDDGEWEEVVVRRKKKPAAGE